MIEAFWRLVTVAGVACVLSLLLTPPVRALMRRLGAVDQPDPRRVNKVPIPRGGGLAVVIAFGCAVTLGVCLWPDLLTRSPSGAYFGWYVAGALVIVVTGFLDDRWGLSPKVKLLGQILAAALVCYGGAHFKLPLAWGDWTLSAWCYWPLTLFWVLGVVNAFNLIDGLDGLSSGLAIIASCGLMGVSVLINHNISPIMSVALIGALIGFLRYNYHPASIFLGDTGSLFVGFTLATMSLSAQRSDAFLVTMGVSILCLGVPLMDTLLAILRRTLRYILLRSDHVATEHGAAASAMTADRDHMHHRLLTMAQGNQRMAVWGLYALAIALIAIGFASITVRETKATVFLIGFLACAAVVIRMMTNIELWDAGRLLSRQGSRNGKRLPTALGYLLVDGLAMVGIYLLLAWIMHEILPTMKLSVWLHLFLAYAVPVFLAMVAIGSYTRIWGRSTRKDSFILVASVAIASLISHLICVYLVPALAEQMVEFHIFWSMSIIFPFLVVRLWKAAFLQFVATAENRRLMRQSLTDPTIERILFYGAGVTLRAYITFFEVNVTHNHVALIGVLDDNLGLRGRIFRDLPILGPLEALRLPGVMEKLRPTKIIVTTPTIPESRMNTIRAFCTEHRLQLTQCAIGETPLLP